MAWSKIKNIVLIILIAVNLVLLVMVCTRKWSWAQYQEEGRTYTVALLKKNGISFLPDDIPDDPSLSTLSVTWSGMGAEEDEIAYGLLGEYEKETQPGDIQISYTSSLGTASFYSSGLFQATFQADALRTSGLTFEEHSAQLLGEMGMEGLWTDTSQDGNYTTVTFYQIWEEQTIFSCQISFLYEGAYLYSVDGQRVSGTATMAEGDELPTFSTALVQFLGGVNDGTISITTQITDMTWGYQATLNRPINTLIPTWRITTDTGIYYVDAQGVTVG